MRHGQTVFNLEMKERGTDPGVPDPGLTELGRQQALDAARKMEQSDELPVAILTSPYRRTLETAEIVASVIDRPIVIEPLIREHVYFSCDQGTHRSELQKFWPQHDFSLLPEVWWSHDDESHDIVTARAMAFHDKARKLVKEDEPWLVVSHWAFLLSLTGYKFLNGEYVAMDPDHLDPQSVIPPELPVKQKLS
ncbi:histidine phosphatase family protein [Kiloniella sp. b19]|uniref:histidine phosphatase family protein n=1 Tax=Kiloniella sp. GXU_MW_B19 TaxID=3141326 RepID=UPI0031D3BAAA